MNTRLLLQGIVVLVIGVGALTQVRRMVNFNLSRRWDPLVGHRTQRQLDGPDPRRRLAWAYGAAAVGAILLGLAWTLEAAGLVGTKYP